MNLTRITRASKKHRGRTFGAYRKSKSKRRGAKKRKQLRQLRQGEDGGEPSEEPPAEEGEEDEAEVYPEQCYGLLVTALVMNIFLVILLTLFMIIRATNLATAICNECCVPMEC